MGLFNPTPFAIRRLSRKAAGREGGGGLGPRPAPKKTPDLSPSCRPAHGERGLCAHGGGCLEPGALSHPAAPPRTLHSEVGSSQINPQTQNLVCRRETAAWASAESRCGEQRGHCMRRLGPRRGLAAVKLTLMKPWEAPGPSGRSLPDGWRLGTGSLSQPTPTGQLHPHTQGHPSSRKARVMGRWLLGMETHSLGAQDSKCQNGKRK